MASSSRPLVRVYKSVESQGAASRRPPPKHWDDAVAPPCDLDEDVYALAISDLTRDFQLRAHGQGDVCTFAARFTTDFLLLFGCILVQCFLLLEVQRFITAKAVYDIRIVYDAFEMGMYTSDPSCYETTVNGFRRGLSRCFNASAFENLSEDVQSEACHIPLAHPLFFGTVLWLWTAVCMGHLYKAYRQFKGLILNTKTVDSMDNPFEGEFTINTVDTFSLTLDLEDAGDREEAIDGEQVKVIQQLTFLVKGTYTVFIFLPKFCVTLYLLWLGCRWLLATNNFEELILNAVALEFILDLGSLVYLAMLPERFKHDLALTKIMPANSVYAVGCTQFGKVVFFNVLNFAWVLGFMQVFQTVLPDYKWDVRDVCNTWLQTRYPV